jgi:hypothetical protein
MATALGIIALLLLCIPAPVHAQTGETGGSETGQVEEEEEIPPEMPYIRVTTMPKVRIHVTPPEEGTDEERDFFRDNFRMELETMGYEVVETQAESDYYMVLTVTRYEEEDVNELTLTLHETKSGRNIVQISQTYNQKEDMYQYNMYLIDQAMNNTSVVKIPSDAVMEGGIVGNVPNKTEQGNEKKQFRAAFFAGLWLGGSAGWYALQTAWGYGGGVSRSLAGEGTVSGELHLFHHLSFEVGFTAVYESFGASRSALNDNNTAVVIGTGIFRTLSMQIPFYIKIPITLNRAFLTPKLGLYYRRLLLPMSADFGDGDKYSENYSIDPPIGISLGLDTGLFAGRRGKISAGLRFDMDLGTTNGGNNHIPVYSRNSLVLSIGYAWKLWEKK